MKFNKLIKYLSLYVRSVSAERYAKRHKLLGCEFDKYGRDLGWKLLRLRTKEGFKYLVNPVSIFRYFEFEFVSRCINFNNLKVCMDVSSPALFSLYLSQINKVAAIHMINPDVKDLSETANIVNKLCIKNLTLSVNYVEVLAQETHQNKYDHLWSISVIEHISGSCDDTQAIKLMYKALAPGGKLILTLPVDRKFWNEYRDVNTYGLLTSENQDGYFFQRYYDEQSIYERLLSPLGTVQAKLSWFGEKKAGHFAAYEKRWMSEGLKCTVDDPREIVDHYKEFAHWSDMPGRGVCGVLITKPS